jgi:RNA polymerase sigma-70 factor (family 1)
MPAPAGRALPFTSTPQHPGAEVERGWVDRIRSGDEGAFNEMFTAYYQVLCRFATGILHSADAAEDTVQAVFVAIWNFRAEWQVRQSLRVYLYAAVRNRAIQEVRKCRTRKRLLDFCFPGRSAAANDGEASPTATSLDHAELASAIERAIDALPPRGQQAFRLHRDHGLTYEEIAGVMGISAKTVSVHIGRALVTLRKSLAGYLAPVLALVALR